MLPALTLPLLLSSPAALVATVLLFLVALEAHRMLRAALRQRKKGSKLFRKAVMLPKQQTSMPVDVETPKVQPKQFSFPELTFKEPKKTAIELPGKSVSLLPVNEVCEAPPMTRPLERVPIERLCSSEERLAAAIKAAINVAPREARPVQPLAVLARLRAKKTKVSFGCGNVQGTQVTLIDNPIVKHAPRLAHPACSRTFMPSRATDEQAKSLIGEAVKVARCAECTRPLPTAQDSVLLCTRCQKQIPSVDNLETGWAPVVSRRRRRSEKAKSSSSNSRKSKSSSKSGNDKSGGKSKNNKSRRRRSEKTSNTGSTVKPCRRRSTKAPTRA